MQLITLLHFEKLTTHFQSHTASRVCHFFIFGFYLTPNLKKNPKLIVDVKKFNVRQLVIS